MIEKYCRSEDLLGVNIVFQLTPNTSKSFLRTNPNKSKDQILPIGSRESSIHGPWTTHPKSPHFGEVEEVVPVPPVARVPLVPRAELEGAARCWAKCWGKRVGSRKFLEAVDTQPHSVERLSFAVFMFFECL